MVLLYILCVHVMERPLHPDFIVVCVTLILEIRWCVLARGMIGSGG